MQKRISYYEYKKRFPDFETVFESYDKRTKTIIVEFPDDFEYTEPQKSNWIKIEVHPENVFKKKNFVGIRLPYCSEYRDYVVFVSPKLVKSEFVYTLSIQDNFTMKLKKYDGKELMDEKELPAKEFAELFDCPLSAQLPPLIHIPKYHAPILVEVLEELKDDE